MPNSGVTLALLPTSSVAFALGVSVGRKHRPPGQLAALVDELKRRGVFDDMTAAMDSELVRTVGLLYAMDRGQAWHRAGRRPG